MLSSAIKSQIKQIHQKIKISLPAYQPRPSQNKLVAEMANIVAGSYHSYDRIGLIEAGTGTAYFVTQVPDGQKGRRSAYSAAEEELVDTSPLASPFHGH